VLAYAAKLLTEAGDDVIVDATAPRRAWRQAARDMIPCFVEVQLLCPAEDCFERERAARWQQAGTPATDGAPDIAIEYEESFRPELIVYTNVPDAWGAVDQVLFFVHRLRRVTPSRLAQSSLYR
jgi:adenylylsulfate kinase